MLRITNIYIGVQNFGYQIGKNHYLLIFIIVIENVNIVIIMMSIILLIRI